MIRICKECGHPFEPTNGKQKYCMRIHYRKCVICGSEFEVSRYHLTAKDAKTTCSKKCSAELRKQTNTYKYGGPAPACSSDVLNKMQATNLDRYGVKYAAQSEVCKSKSVETAMSKYGVPHHAKTPESKQKLSHRWDDPAFVDKVKKSQMNTSLERYGVPYPMQSSIVANKFIKSHMSDSSKLNAFLSFKDDPRSFILGLKLDRKPTLLELTKILGVNESTVGANIHRSNCEDLIEFHVSKMEQEVTDFILSIAPDINIEFNTHTVIPPYEIDIYLPDYKVGIECNPTATHNSTINVFDKSTESAIAPGYHKMKSDMCESVGVRLFHIFSSEWTYNRNIIESMIANILNVHNRRMFARNCTIKEVPYLDATKFLYDNHRQGNAKSSVRLGLYLNDELVSIMTFGKTRHTIGTGNEDLSQCWELIRFCSKLNSQVIGGASKLFNHFVNNYTPLKIRSFSDRAHTTGNLYSVLGFKELRRSSAGYSWVDLKTDVSYNRVNAQKYNISRFLNDDNLDTSKSEKAIMTEHGYVQVFDSGTITWEWTNKFNV